MNMYIFSLILFPLIFSLLFLLNNNRKYYAALSALMCVVGTALSVMITFKGTGEIALEGGWFSFVQGIVLFIEVLILVYLFWMSYRHKRKGVFFLTFVQALIMVYSEFFSPKHHEIAFSIDKLSLIMLLIINIIGTLIVVFSNGYITHYEEHRHLKNRQKLYYSIICLFLAAMNGIVATDSLSVLYFFWEITTLSSFILISYNKDEEAYNSGFRALFLNLIGGICFSIGNVLLSSGYQITTMTQIIDNKNSAILFPVFLLCIAGFAKSAQVPFQSWLLGAMVAPTPISALLHSSTMVKAGVYLIVKLSPAYVGTYFGTMVAIFGAFSFVLCSALAIAQNNAKRVLAYSTIANLGLIITSAGIGSSAALSAALALIIFHAISKALLFLCAGQIEHVIGSRDIEDMSGLRDKSPMLAYITALGMASMILPPFGVLITKWLSMEASASNPIVAILVILGGALTTVFWLKWLGTILSHGTHTSDEHHGLENVIKIPLLLLSAMIVVTCLFISQIFNNFITPEVNSLLKIQNELTVQKGNIITSMGAFNEIDIIIALIIFIVIYVLIKLFYKNTSKVRTIYMCGENNLPQDKLSFRAGNGAYEKATVSNFYLYDWLKEKSLIQVGYGLSMVILLMMVIGGVI